MTSRPQDASKVTLENLRTGEVEVFKGLIVERGQSFGYLSYTELGHNRPTPVLSGRGELTLTMQYVDLVVTPKGTDS